MMKVSWLKHVPCGLLLVTMVMTTYVSAAEIHAELPPVRSNDEAALLAAAKAVEPEILENGYRQYDITTAVLNTWDEDEPMQMMIRLWLPPKEVEGPYPLTAYLHGGGFMGGNYKANLLSTRGGFAPSWRAALDDGFAVASFSYRTARKAGWPAPVSDALMHFRFLRDHGQHWQLNTERFGVHGHSAGARAAALVAAVEQNDFHVADLPWQGEPVVIAGALLWAGAALTSPGLHEFVEFGKGRHWSVPRLHHGEHPAWTDSTRHSLRIRNNWPHITTALPPLYMVRGENDYEGLHDDAEETIALWQALGIEASMAIIPGEGHGASGPPEPFVVFWRQHLREEPFTPPQREYLSAARVALDHGHVWGAVEILNAAHTSDDGRQAPAGQWVFTSAQTMHWLPDHSDWEEEAIAIAEAARSAAAQKEAAASEGFLQRGQWYRAAEAAKTIRLLMGEDADLQVLVEDIEQATAHENAVFQALYKANQHLHADGREAAKDVLSKLEDPRLDAAWQGLEAIEVPTPAWADATGVDLYGPWASLQVSEEVEIRLRWVEPGTWELPEYLHFRNHSDEPFITKADIPQGFWIAETATTLAQWRSVLSGDGEAIDAHRRDYPRVRTHYLDIVAWLDTLSERHDELLARLPTEEEWLYAASAGGRSDFMGGTDMHAVHAGNVDSDNPGPLPVTSTVPCLSGLYGILGGVMEWTASPDRRTSRFTDDDGNFRIVAYPMTRGGAWSSMPHQLDLGVRHWQRHANVQPDLGFRLVIAGGPEEGDWRRAVIQR